MPKQLCMIFHEHWAPKQNCPCGMIECVMTKTFIRSSPWAFTDVVEAGRSWCLGLGWCHLGQLCSWYVYNIGQHSQLGRHPGKIHHTYIIITEQHFIQTWSMLKSSGCVFNYLSDDWHLPRRPYSLNDNPTIWKCIVCWFYGCLQFIL